MKELSTCLVVLGVVACVVGFCMFIMFLEVGGEAQSQMLLASVSLIGSGVWTVALGLSMLAIADIRDELGKHTQILTALRAHFVQESEAQQPDLVTQSTSPPQAHVEVRAKGSGQPITTFTVEEAVNRIVKATRCAPEAVYAALWKGEALTSERYIYRLVRREA